MIAKRETTNTSSPLTIDRSYGYRETRSVQVPHVCLVIVEAPRDWVRAGQRRSGLPRLLRTKLR